MCEFLLSGLPLHQNNNNYLDCSQWAIWWKYSMCLIMCVCSDCIDYNSILASKSLWAVVSEQLLKSLYFLSKTLSSVVISFNFTMTQLLHYVFLKVSCKCSEISQFLVMFKIIEFFKANEMKISVPYFLWYLIHFE